MPWYYMEDDQQIGPISDQELQQRIESGVIGPTTQVKNETMEDWIKANQLPDEETSSLTTCSMCGNKFTDDELIQFEGASVCASCKPQFLQQMKENAEISGEHIFHYAGFWRRFGAVFIDGLVMSIFSIPANIFFQYSMRRIAEGNKSPFIALAVIAYSSMLIIPAIYMIWLNGKYGATLGKKALGIKIIMSDGKPISYGRAIGRYFSYMLSGLILNIGYLMAAFDGEKRALHDHICNTRVVYK
ncbi:RDD family protein [Tichowtungia aerotolerans]|uniref:DUF4339 domain-containing protein n=1 Tax=Tichowtungia aerotolerans TaxID=2697043 RepID=A0A6P1M0T1_9BACT|nr:RDD family protein [Tichowtungia aerotolerans]QHI68399.1 DUF4339 domain-containing protein [Tichowtungia aerotolerans]